MTSLSSMYFQAPSTKRSTVLSLLVVPIEFSAAMERRGLNAVTAPAVVSELSTSKILVTEWVEGTRLDRDASEDVPRLCGVAINAYLTMLLDTGTLHCDPHPGNRT